MSHTPPGMASTESKYTSSRILGCSGSVTVENEHTAAENRGAIAGPEKLRSTLIQGRPHLPGPTERAGGALGLGDHAPHHQRSNKKSRPQRAGSFIRWWRGSDLNQRPSGYEFDSPPTPTSVNIRKPSGIGSFLACRFPLFVTVEMQLAACPRPTTFDDRSIQDGFERLHDRCELTDCDFEFFHDLSG